MWRLLSRLLGRPAPRPTTRRATDALARAAELAAHQAGDARRAAQLRDVLRAADARNLGAKEAAVTELLRVPGVADQSRLTPPIGFEGIRRRGGRNFLPALLLGAALGAALAAPAAAPAQTTIRDLTIAEGAAPIRLTGYGIAVGLDGTGDRTMGGGTRGGGMTVQSVVNLLRNFNVVIPPELVRTRNAAVVLVTAEVSPYLRAGGRFEVHVSSLGDARSLRGGVLYMAPLVAEAGGRPVGVAQGALLLSEAADGRAAYGAARTPETTARIPSGGQLEADMPRPQFAGGTRLLLKEPDVTTASRIAAAVNQALGGTAARVEDPGAVALTLPDSGNRAEVLGRIAALPVRAERAPRLVIDARDGTVVAGGALTVAVAVVSHGGVTLTIGGDSTAAPAAGAARQDAVPGDVRIAPGTSVQRLAAALHAVQTPASDIAAIFAALREVGAIAAEVVVR
ncbi:flagellar basal body P-ring protein FlgI [Roseisolibacter sp. H3M3-2]|uniref:flagellar basal body P-ring protein FlgI n=1 Tax=Roseisolibacter sp. H3M3-2 TaxID=3031323 RepID=UPI0023DA4B34|nr:flagellar basal body P-ring protein FlgI [Roseisolibacter sp. H3M3-2]MDF1506061.1 flagellar basal body P-ring protein FlgI [Roseisolibacter sp. H3M3-2]